MHDDRWWWTGLAVGLAALGATSSAAPVAVVGQETPTFWLDETYTMLDLRDELAEPRAGSRASVWRYRVALKARVYGPVARGDALIVRWKHDGRELARVRCALDPSDGYGTTALSDACWGRADADLDATGEIEVGLSVMDDSEDREVPLRALSVRVARFWQPEDLNRGIYAARHQVVGDDLLGLSWLWMAPPGRAETRGELYFYFWAALADGDSSFPDPSLRCRVNGAPVTLQDDPGHLHESLGRFEARDVRRQGGRVESRAFGYHLMWVKPRITFTPTGAARADDPRFLLDDHVGQWECRFRSEGEAVRTWRFEVQPGATILPHDVQRGDDPLRLRPGAVFIETSFPARNPHEFTFQPAVLRRQVAYGHRWPNRDAVAGMLAALPDGHGASTLPPPTLTGC